MSNPVFNDKAMNAGDSVSLSAEPMTINGAVNKTFILLGFLVASSFLVWTMFSQNYVALAEMLGIVGAIVGFILAMVIIFTKKAMHVLTPLYAVAEGLFIGGISAKFEAMYPGIVMQAIVATMFALFVMLSLYRAGVIKCTEKFRSTLMIAMISIIGIYLIGFIGSFFGYSIPQIHTSSNIGIGFSAIVVVIASLNFIIDFDVIEKGAQSMLPKNFEWYGAFGIMVTLVWLYLEILRLLAKLRER
jgi:uncharacterized YccA/Bax inhibitor family protein